MKRRNNCTCTTAAFPDDNKKSTSRGIFDDILEAAQGQWCPLDRNPTDFQRMGHMNALGGKRSLRVILSFESESDLIRLWVIVANHVQNTPEVFHDMLYRATAAYPKGKVIYDSNLRIIIAQASCDRPTHEVDLRRIVVSIYRDFGKLLNDDCLCSALAIAKAHLLGTPLDVWNHK